MFLKLIDEKEKSSNQIDEWRNKCTSLQSELDKSNELRQALSKEKEELRVEIDCLKELLNGATNRIEHDKQEKINQLQLELVKSNSKLDEANFQINALKTNYSEKLKQVRMEKIL